MPTLGHGRWSWAVGGVPLDIESTSLFENYYYQEIFSILLTITSLEETYWNFTNAYNTRTPIKMETLPLVWINHWS